MARNGSGTYNLVSGNPVVTGTIISSTWANNTLNDIATALSGSIAADGQTPITANLPMAGYKLTNVGAGSLLTDYARIDQLQNSSITWLTGVTGTDTITASLTITPSAYAAGQSFKFVAANTNTGAATLNINSIGAKAITKNGTTALIAGDIQAGAVIVVTYDGTQFQIGNASSFAINATNSTNATTSTTQSVGDNTTKIATTAFVLANSITASYASLNYAALAGINSQVFNVAPATATSHAVQYNQALGLGQTRQNVTASRTIGVNYVNGNSKPIEVTIQAGLTSGNGLSLNDDAGSSSVISGNSTTVIFLTMSLIIPPGGTYSVSYFVGGTSTNFIWEELR